MKVTLDLNDSSMSFNTLKKEYAIAELAGDSSFFKKEIYVVSFAEDRKHSTNISSAMILKYALRRILSTRSNRFEWSLNVGAEETSAGYRWYYVVPRVQ